MKNIIKTTIALALMFVFAAKATAQEWETVHEYAYSDTCIFNYYEAKEMANGNIAVESYMAYKSGVGDFYSLQPAVAVIEPENGQCSLCQSYFKPGYYTSNIPYVFEKNDTLYLLATYTPDHDFTYFNYFKNYEEQSDQAYLGLYRLDDNLDVAASYETTMTIDTFEWRNNSNWQGLPNDYSGSLFLFSAVQEDDAIVGAYVKRRSLGNDLVHDSLFFFRMNYQGEILHQMGYQMKSTNTNLSRTFFLRRHHLVRNGSGFIIYDLSNNINLPGKAENNDYDSEGFALYLDHDFNCINAKAFCHYNNHSSNRFYDMSVVRSHQGTTYMATEFFDANQSSSGISSCALYEYDDGNGKLSYLNMLNHTQRYQFNRMDFTPQKGVDICPTDWTLYFGYTLNAVTASTDSWMMIEHLYAHFDTISTMYYDFKCERCRSFMSAITATQDGGCMIVYNAKNLDQTNQRWSCVTKFPAEAFVGIEEAHDNGLKVAVAYPNPGKDVLNIRTGLKDARVDVYDMNGRMVYGQEITENVTSINAEGWPSGAYVWKVYTGVSTGSTTLAESGKWVKR